MTNLETFFDSVRLPSLSHVTEALIRTLSSETQSIEDISGLIARDPALAAQLLKMANSSLFGMSRSVGSLSDAVAIVGMNRVRSLALGVSLTASFHDFPGLDRETFWRSAMECAGYAQWIAKRTSIQPETAWLTGMMLRLGQLLIAQAKPEVLEEIESLPRIPGVRWQREKRLIGFTEGQITAEMARRWNFPPQMVQAFKRAADPMAEDGFSRLGAVIHLAGLLAETPDAGPQSVAALPTEVLNVLQLDSDWMRATFPDRTAFVNVT
jgi:HD-like signal output (HDOD) protein